MAEQKLDQQQILEQQKQQCPFCKIIKGDIPSKKVFEDDKLVAILDINPVREGHILLMPKEHYPIMPLIPQQVLERLFVMTKRLCEIDRIVFEKSGTTIFIANGAVAGQQSAHFMLHIIPRNDADGLDNFDIPDGPGQPEKHRELLEVLASNLPEMLRERYAKFPLRDSQGNVLKLPRREKRFSKLQVLQIIDNNPQLKELILKQPEQFVASIEKSQQLKQLFIGLNVHEIVKGINPKYKKENVIIAEFSEEKKQGPAGWEAEEGMEKEDGKQEPAEIKEEKKEKKARARKKEPGKKAKQAEPAALPQQPDSRADLDLISRLF